VNFDREILKKLKTWAASPARKPLVLRGARQVGKTTAVKLFAKDFEHFIYLNLERPSDREYFDMFVSVGELMKALCFERNIPFSSKGILLFIDEIQSEPRAVEMLRFFYEDLPEVYVIAAGSMLETMLSDKISMPVGRVEYLVLRPVSFREYLLAKGETEALQALEQIPLPAFAYPKLLTLFHEYALIGGMPEIVQRFLGQGDLTSLKPVYNTLLTAYLEDVKKYAHAKLRSEVLTHCMRSVFLEAGHRIKFQGFGNAPYSSREVGEALRTFEKALLLHLVYPTTETQVPALPNLRKRPYLQVLDTGLVNYFSGWQTRLLGIRDLQEAYKGRIVQHWVGQMMLANWNEPLEGLLFWVREKRQSSAEVDFLFPFEDKLIPLEVKSGAAGKLKSLHQFMDLCNHHLAIRLYAGPLTTVQPTTPAGKTFKLLNLPYFLGEQLPAYVQWLASSP